MKCAVEWCDRELRSTNKSGYCGQHAYKNPVKQAYMKEYNEGLHRARAEKAYYSDISYHATHKRIRQVRGSASEQPCIMCGKPAEHWAYRGNSQREQAGWENAEKTQFALWSSDPADYDPLCAQDHRQSDAAYARTIEFQAKKLSFMAKELGTTVMAVLEKYCA